MAEGGSLHKEAIATVQLTYSSENPILVNYIKEEPEDEIESEVLQLSHAEQPPPPPTSCCESFDFGVTSQTHISI